MAYRLQMNGGTDHIKLPSITFNKVILDIKVQRRVDVVRWYYDFRTGFSFAYIQSTTAGVDAEGNDTPMSTYIDGIGPKTSSTVMVPDNVRCLLETRWATAAADDGNIFSTSSGTSGQIGDIWDVKLYNEATLVAHYDMTLGNVQDQSGNGYHATLVGGTWINESTGTAYTASLSDAIATSDTLSKRLSVAVIDVVITSETESERASKALADALTTSDSFTSKRGKAISVSDSVAITDTIRKALTIVKTDAVNATETERESTTRKLTDILSPVDAINVTGGKAVILADNFTVSDTVRKSLSKAVAESLGVADNASRNVSARVYDVILTTETLTKQLPNAPTIIGTVTLAGSRELNVYLLGSRVVDVTLRGEV